MTSPNIGWLDIDIKADDQLGSTAGIHMQTIARINRKGQLFVTSRGENCCDSEGFLGLILLLYGHGHQPEWLWNTSPVRFGVQPFNRRWDHAGVQFTQDIPLSVLASARYAAVKQFLSPSTDVWSDIKAWLAEAQAPTSGFDRVRASAHPLRAENPQREDCPQRAENPQRDQNPLPGGTGIRSGVDATELVPNGPDGSIYRPIA